MIIASIAIANSTIGQPSVHTVLDIVIFGFVATPIDISQIPSDSIASGYGSFQVIVAGLKEFIEGLTGQARALVTGNGKSF